MTTSHRAALIVALLLGFGCCAKGQQTDASYSGLSRTEFRAFADSLPELPGRIRAMSFLRESGEEAGIAVATSGEHSGWQLFVFDSSDGAKFRLEWKSGRLGDGFAVSWPGALKAFNFGGQEGIVFDGCAAEVCPDVYSVLLYVPSKHTAFIAKSVYGKVSYAGEVGSPSNRRYKDALDQLLGEYKAQQ